MIDPIHTASPVIEIFDELYGKLRLPAIFFDVHGRLLKANTAFCELAEISPDSLHDKTMTFFFRGITTLVPSCPQWCLDFVIGNCMA